MANLESPEKHGGNPFSAEGLFFFCVSVSGQRPHEPACR
ncbi:hypothetical protein SF06_03540 [Pseudomonas flexibilis]|nr:hypothetical protein SF06_03540 [Pseudomonas flexibilis]